MTRLLPEIYDARFDEREVSAKDAVWREIVRFLQRYIQSDGPLLDIACDRGHFVRFAQASELWATDIRDVSAALPPGIRFVQASGLDLELVMPTGHFATVFMSNYLEHLDSGDAVIEQLRVARNLLRPGGRVIVLQPNIRLVGPRYWDFIDHRVALTERSLLEAAEIAGLHTVELVTRFLPYSTKGRLPGDPRLVRAYLAFRPGWPVFGKQTLFLSVDGISRSEPLGLRWLAVLAAVTALCMVPFLTGSIQSFDGGITASAATFTLHGLAPYRDYWLLYGPAGGWALAPIVAIFGNDLAVLRVVAAVTAIALALVSASIARTWAPRMVAGLIGLSAAVIATAAIGLEVNQWTIATTLALGAILVGIRSGRPTVWQGVLIGLAFAVRLDVGAYALLACLVMPGRRPILAGFAVVAVPLAVFAVLAAPIEDLVQQLVWYPLVGPRQFRGVPDLGVTLPPLVAAVATVALVVMPRALIVGGLVVGLRRPTTERPLLVLSIFAALCQLQTLGRADVAHFALAAPPAVIIVARCLAPWAREGAAAATSGSRSSLARSALVGLVVSGVVVGASIAGILNVAPDGGAHDRSLVAAARAAEAMTTRDEPIFVGLTSNRHTLINPLIVYFLADRAPGTSQTMYNPGVTNTDATQARMVDELVASETRILVLDERWAQSFEAWNDSRIPGSTILDDFIATRFTTVCDFDGVRVVARTDIGAPAPACPGA